MTEQEYIYVRDLSNVMAAYKLLRDLNDKHNGIPAEEYREMLRALDRWRDRLFSKIETTNPIT